MSIDNQLKIDAKLQLSEMSAAAKQSTWAEITSCNARAPMKALSLLRSYGLI